jgi:hypothetical protein
MYASLSVICHIHFLAAAASLHLTALLSGAVGKTSSCNRKKLERHNFQKACPELRLDERGGGWWAWKPFIILKELETMPDGHWLLYCDVGRVYPFKVIDRRLDRLIRVDRRLPTVLAH